MGDIHERQNLVNTTSPEEGSENKEIQHLIKKKQKNAQVLRLYRELKKLDVGTNDIEQMSANLVISRLNMEGVDEKGRGLGEIDSTTCWRDSKTVMKLIDLKIKQIKKYGEKLNKQILVIFKAEYNREKPSVFRKAKIEMIKRSNKLWEEGLVVQNNKIKHLSWKWGSCNKHPCCNWVRRRRASLMANDSTVVNVDIDMSTHNVDIDSVDIDSVPNVLVNTFVHSFHSEGRGEVGNGYCVPVVHIFPSDGEGREGVRRRDTEEARDDAPAVPGTSYTVCRSSPDVVAAQVEVELCL